MGKGDRRTRKGKIVRGTYGNVRKRKQRVRPRHQGKRKDEQSIVEEGAPKEETQE